MIPSAWLLISVSLPIAVRRYGPGLVRDYLIAGGIVFNVSLILLLVWG